MNNSQAAYAPPNNGLDLIYLDESLLVVNKPAGLLSVPGRGVDKLDSLATRVQQRYPDALIVHRLDMATSGLLVFARGVETQRNLSKLFRERRVEKHYVAVVPGRVWPTTGEINLPLISDWSNRPRQKVDFVIGKPSLTRYRVLEHGCLACSSIPVRSVHARNGQGFETSRVELEPITGRTHQLRVHMSAIGHPILGDTLYGGEAGVMAERLLLHARVLVFTHPLSGELLTMVCEPPF